MKKKNKSIFFIMPMVIILFAMVMNDILFPPLKSAMGASFISDPRRMIILGVAYIIGLITFFRTLQLSVFVIKQNIVYVIFLLLALLSLFWSSYPTNVVINFGHYCGYLLAVLAAVYYFRYDQENCFRFFSIILGVALLISIVVSVFLPNIGVHHITGRWQGVAGNPNSLGVICILSIWANISDIFVRKDNKLWQSSFLLIITIIALIGARSTTSFIVSFFCAIGIWFLCSLQNKSKPIRVGIIVFTSWFVVMFFLGIYINIPEVLTIDGSLALAGKDATLTGRTNIWKIAESAISMKPYFGWSFDSNRSALSYLNFMYGQFHNGYIDLLVRGGYIGLVFFFVLVMQTLYRIRKLAEYEYRHAVSWLVLLGCILVHNITESSIMRETHLFWFFFVFFLCILPSYSLLRRHVAEEKLIAERAEVDCCEANSTRKK